MGFSNNCIAICFMKVKSVLLGLMKWVFSTPDTSLPDTGIQTKIKADFQTPFAGPILRVMKSETSVNHTKLYKSHPKKCIIQVFLALGKNHFESFLCPSDHSQIEL